jgi:hypothetical protein
VTGGFDDWSIDTSDFLDPMLPTQMGHPNTMDMTSEIAWDSLLGADHSSLGQ